MYAANHPGIRIKADMFLSHVQSELIKVTIKAMRAARRYHKCGLADPAFFVDYFALRQCLSDFVPHDVLDTIGSIGHTVLVLDPMK